MSWLGPSGIWTKRVSITLIANAAGALDYSIIIPSSLDDFWDTIDTSGNELRITDGKNTTLTYLIRDISGAGAFDKPNRSGSILIDNYTAPAQPAAVQLFMYYGSTSNQGAATGGAAVPTKVGYIEMSRPRGREVYNHGNALPGALVPPFNLQKTAAEVKDIWVRYPLPGSWTQANATDIIEDLWYATQQVLNTSAVDQPAMYTVNDIRFVWIQSGPARGSWVRYTLLLGTTANKYTLSGTVRSTFASSGNEKPVFNTRIGVYVDDVLLT
jgi:hypothetical protein